MPTISWKNSIKHLYIKNGCNFWNDENFWIRHSRPQKMKSTLKVTIHSQFSWAFREKSSTWKGYVALKKKFSKKNLWNRKFYFDPKNGFLGSSEWTQGYSLSILYISVRVSKLFGLSLVRRTFTRRQKMLEGNPRISVIIPAVKVNVSSAVLFSLFDVCRWDRLIVSLPWQTTKTIGASLSLNDLCSTRTEYWIALIISFHA